jgi:hypothetical protein
MGKTMRYSKDEMESLHNFYVAKNKVKKQKKNKGDKMVNIRGDKIEVVGAEEANKINNINKGEIMENQNLQEALKAGLEAMDNDTMVQAELTDAEKAQLEESLKAYESAAIAAKEAVFTAIEKGEKMEDIIKTENNDRVVGDIDLDRDFPDFTEEQKQKVKTFLETNKDAIENVRKFAEEEAAKLFNKVSEKTSATAESIEETYEDVKEEAKETYENVKETFEDAGETFEDAKEKVENNATGEVNVSVTSYKMMKRLGLVAATTALAVGGFVAYKLLGGKTAAEEAVDAVVEAFRK